MKAKSRRRLLISSVAMLLVAMLALGTATFAWFTTSTSATANGINVGTVKSSNLKISKVGHSWVDGFSYDHNNQLYKPTSSIDGVTWYTAVAAAKDNYAKNSDAYGTAGTVAATNTASLAGINNYVYVNELNVKNEGEVAASDVKITIQGDFSDYVRVALVPSDENYKMTGTFADAIYAKDATKYTPGYDTTEITPISTREITIGALNAGAARYYRLFVWFEGEDTDCKDTNAGQTLPNLTFAVSGSTGQG